MAGKAQKPTPKGKDSKPSPRQMCEAFGEDAVLDRLRAGSMLGEIAKEIGVSRGTLTTWIGLDADRSARAREARAESAAVYDEMAFDALASATDPFSLSKAKEIGHHLRWRASKINPREYGDKQQITHDGAVGVGLFSEEQVKKMAARILNADD